MHVKSVKIGRTEGERDEVAAVFLEHGTQVGILHIDPIVNAIERSARLPVLRAHEKQRICRIESLIIVECPTITIESM